jgi:hypothetical protein
MPWFNWVNGDVLWTGKIESCYVNIHIAGDDRAIPSRGSPRL